MKEFIQSVRAREILDSRGNPTVEVEVRTRRGFGRAAAPSGASTGAHEALELRDGAKHFLGRGVLRAVANVNGKIARALKGLDALDQRNIDQTLIALDGTPNKSRLGANATTAVSLAVARAAASAQGTPLYKHLNRRAFLLPVPFLNVINGGKHAGNELAVQEFLIAPIGAPSFREALRMAAEVYHTLGKNLKEAYGVSARNVGDEGGFAPGMKTTREALDALSKAVSRAGYEDDVKLAVDAAATSFYDGRSGMYKIDGRSLDREGLLEHYAALCGDYDIVSLEDPLHEEDFAGFARSVELLGKEVQIVGDDLLATNIGRLKQAIAASSVTALLLKINQVGTLSEALDAASLAFSSNLSVMVSHRSGETEDASIADVAVGISAGQIKTGAPARGERTCKYNQLLRIEEELGKKARYAGRKFRSAGIIARR
ncbi:MAG: phosphopyruvate hydratase [Candidatus Micrarchaeia archaeon]